jgi:hypothetical protein
MEDGENHLSNFIHFNDRERDESHGLVCKPS